MLVPVLLAGGVGTRLWPLSRESRPKQFLQLAGDRSLLEQCVARLKHLDDVAAPLLVGNGEYRFVMAEQMRSAGASGRVLLEPAARNTAPAVAAAAFEARALHGPQCELLVLPTDHAIGDEQAFAQAVAQARLGSNKGQLTMFGVRPLRAEIGYGYIQAGEKVTDSLRRVSRFVEKPDTERAEAYLASGDYFWNSGMFLFTAQDYLDELATQAPAIFEAVAASHEAAESDMDFLRLEPNAFERSPSDSIDYAVMEGTSRAAMVELDAQWSDLGSWSAVASVAEADEHANSVRGDVWLEDVHHSVIRSEGRLVAAIGVKDQLIVETEDAVLVADRSREQQIKGLVARLKAQGRTEATAYRKAYRPWGSYEQIAKGQRFQVKHIRVTPGGRLSLQKHHHRAEHWVVVHGTALVTCDGRETLLTENQSTYIPLGAVHRLENPGKVDLDLIEVQSGSYLGEDDIVRLDDVYGRADAEPSAGNAVEGSAAPAPDVEQHQSKE